MCTNVLKMLLPSSRCISVFIIARDVKVNSYIIDCAQLYKTEKKHLSFVSNDELRIVEIVILAIMCIHLSTKISTF